MNQTPNDHLSLEERTAHAQAELDKSLEEDRKTERKKLIPLAKIIRDKKLQARTHIKTERIEHYAELTEQQPDLLPPIRAYYEPAKDCYWVWDGWTRIAARVHLNSPIYMTTIPALIRIGTREDAIEAAATANADHGEPRTREDQQRAIWNLLEEVEKWRGKSDREIARACALGENSGHKQVARVYQKMVEAGVIPARPEEREGADGKKYKSGGSMTQQSEEPQDEQPELFAPVKVSVPKGPAAKCHCGKLAYDNTHCMEHAAQEVRRPSLLISTPEQSSARVMEVFGAKPQEPSSPSAQSPSVSAPLETPKPRETAQLHALLGKLAQEQIDRGWSVRVDIFGHNKRDYSMVEALTKLPDATVYSQVLGDDERQFSMNFVDAVMGRYLCCFISDPPRKPILPAKLEPEKTAGVESSTPAKNGGYQHWNTPGWLLDLVRKVNRIALDPFHNQWSLVKADRSFTREQDGLSRAHDWAQLSEGGLVYVNPPYDDPMPVAQRAYDEARKGAEIILCLPSSHSTKWYKFLRRWCQGFVTLDRKVDFGREGVFGSTAFHETTLFYFGPKVSRFAGVFGADEVGFFVERSAYVSPPDARQAELPRLEAPPEESAAKQGPNLLFEKCPHCGDSCARGGDVPAGGACDECELDGIACAVCFGDIEDVRTATLLTPAGKTINATWSCATCAGKDAKKTTPVDDSKDSYNPLIGETQTKPASSTCDNCRLPKAIAGSAQGLSVCADCLATLTPKEEAPRLHAILDELRAAHEGWSVRLEFEACATTSSWDHIKEAIDDCDLDVRSEAPYIDNPLSPTPTTTYVLRASGDQKFLGRVHLWKLRGKKVEEEKLGFLCVACGELFALDAEKGYDAHTRQHQKDGINVFHYGDTILPLSIERAPGDVSHYWTRQGSYTGAQLTQAFHLANELRLFRFDNGVLQYEVTLKGKSAVGDFCARAEEWPEGVKYSCVQCDKAKPRAEVERDDEGFFLCHVCAAPPPVKLHKALRDMGAKYQREGYAVQVYQPKDRKAKSVLGAIGSIKNRDVSVTTERDDADGTDAWIVKFDSAPGVGVCSLHAVKKEASPKTEEKPLSYIDKGFAKMEKVTDIGDAFKLYDQLIDKSKGKESDLKEIRERFDKIKKEKFNKGKNEEKPAKKVRGK